jgi:hypothetical protein
MPLNRNLALSRPSSKRGGLKSGWDHGGWSVRAAEMARGTQAWSLVVVGELSVVREQLEHGNGVAQVPLCVVVLAGADDGGRDEVAVARCRLLHEVAPEQLTDEELEDDIRCEDRLALVDAVDRCGCPCHSQGDIDPTSSQRSVRTAARATMSAAHVVTSRLDSGSVS